MSTPEALHLADLLDAGDTYDCGGMVIYGWPVGVGRYDPTDDGAAELRRQHAEIDRLTAALTELMRNFPTDFDLKEAGWGGPEIERAMKAHDAARGAIAKSTGEQP